MEPQRKRREWVVLGFTHTVQKGEYGKLLDSKLQKAWNLTNARSLEDTHDCKGAKGIS